MRHRPCDRDAGFTLIELAVAMVLFGIIVGIAVGPYKRYNGTQQHIGTTRRIVAALRLAQVASVSEGVIYRVDFAPKSFKVYRREPASGAWSLTSNSAVQEGSVAISSTQFTLPDGSSSTSCYFYPRGTASATPSASGIAIVRTGTSRKYTIKVEGLTARVSYA
jgi:prepilin-type N-terminal cleavage/methylation domain-containing protein